MKISPSPRRSIQAFRFIQPTVQNPNVISLFSCITINAFDGWERMCGIFASDKSIIKNVLTYK